MERKSISTKISGLNMFKNPEHEDYIWTALVKESGLGENYNPYFVERSSMYDSESNMYTYTLTWCEADNGEAPEGEDDADSDTPCVGPHNPVQHRDGKEPWCYICGLTRYFHKPSSMFAS